MKITAEDRTVEDDNAAQSYPDEAKGKNVEAAAIKLELEHQSGETNLMKGTPEVITPGEKVRLPSTLLLLPSHQNIIFFLKKNVERLENKMDYNIMALIFGMVSPQKYYK
jgi:hypothetical protein